MLIFLYILKIKYIEYLDILEFNHTSNGYKILINGLFELSRCIFQRNHQYTGSGSVIYVLNIGVVLNLYNCIFFNCSSTTNGGAIWYSSNIENTKILLKRLCINNCYTNNAMYQFGYLLVKNNITLSLNSIYQCDFIKGASYSISLNSGTQYIESVNMTENKLICSAPHFNNANKLDYKYSNIANDLPYRIRLRLDSSTNNFISFLNIINCSSPAGDGIIYSYGNYNLSNLIVFNTKDLFFRIFTGTLNLRDSYISHSGTIGTITTLNVQTNFLTNSFIISNPFCLIELKTFKLKKTFKWYYFILIIIY